MSDERPTSDQRPTPDPYTNAWFQQQFQKMQFHWNRSMAEEAELAHQVVMLRKEVKALSDQRTQDMAKIGELQAKMCELFERLENAAKVVAELKKASKQGKE